MMDHLSFDPALLAFTLDDVAAFSLSLDDAHGAQDDDLAVTLYADELDDRLAAFALVASFTEDDRLREQTTGAQRQLRDALDRWRSVHNVPILISPPARSPLASTSSSPLPFSSGRSGLISRTSSLDLPHRTSPSSSSVSLLLRSEPEALSDDDSNTTDDLVEAGPEQIVTKSIQCDACLYDIEDDDAVLELPCQHTYDIDCIVRFFRTALADDLVFPPRCCGQKIDIENVRDRLPGDLVERIEQRIEERNEVLRVRCPSTSCAYVLGLQTELPPSIECHMCHTVVCTSCRAAHDPGMTCAQHEDALPILDLARQEQWQRCNVCRRFVERTEGCWHMSCLCGAQFCYVCAARWKTCSCPQFPIPQDLRD